MQMAEKRSLAASDADKPLNLRKNSAQKSAESAASAREAADRAQVCEVECVAVCCNVHLPGNFAQKSTKSGASSREATDRT